MKMKLDHKYYLFFFSIIQLTFTYPFEPCIKTKSIVPSYLNSWSDSEQREFIDCNDTSKYYMRMFDKKELTVEGNIIEKRKEGIWKYYLDGKPWYQELYYNDKVVKVTSFKGDWTNFIINDSLRYETTYYKDKLQTSGLLLNKIKTGIWENIDTISHEISFGKYTSELICDTSLMQGQLPPFTEYDTIICYQRKDSTWLYFDTKNKLIKIEVYDKGKLLK